MHVAGGTIVIGTEEDCLWELIRDVGSDPLLVAPPVLEIDNRLVCLSFENCRLVARRPLRIPGMEESVWEGAVRREEGLSLRITFRVGEDTPVIRYRYELISKREHRLTGRNDRPELRYQSLSLAGFSRLTEVRLSDFNELFHSYYPTEAPLSPRVFDAGYQAMGPVLCAENGSTTLLTAYEHGSSYPDAFLTHACGPDRTVRLRPVKGNWPVGHLIGGNKPFQSPWFLLAVVPGTLDDMASTFRSFVLCHHTENAESRKPYVFYNSWARQERSKWWHGHAYLNPMNEADMLREIETAHRMGVEVFVLDTGWYEKTGDWLPSRERFPHGLRPIREKLAQYGMKLGLWFNPLMAAQTSRLLANHPDCIRSWKGIPSKPQPVWETEESTQLCLVSRYKEAFADELIRLAQEEGVRYFKWDAIDQYGCDDPNHLHGGPENSPEERAACHAYELPRAMNEVVDRLCRAVPDAIVDFDVTEPGRAVGLGFLASGKYFLINNGPYFQNLDIPYDTARENSNAFFFPGQARSRICRVPLAYDRWIPSALFLCHYLPDDPASSQWASIASLMLGHHGIWGDLSLVSDAGVNRFGTALQLYRDIREDALRADPVRIGEPGTSLEIHEKINPATGKGLLCLFSGCAGTHEWLTSCPVAASWWSNEAVSVVRDAHGYARVYVSLEEAGAVVVMFGVSDSPHPFAGNGCGTPELA
jgi:alpha-galactosidase